MISDMDQDKLAEAWVQTLEEIGESDLKDAVDAPAPADGAVAAVFDQALAETMAGPGKKKEGSKPQVDSAKPKDMAEGAKCNLDSLLDIPLEVSVELGRTRLLINELLQLGQGSVVELNKLVGEALDVYVNGKLVARGEAVVIHEKFGVRLTDVIRPVERVKQLA